MTWEIKVLKLLKISMLGLAATLIAGCIFVRDRTFERKPDGTIVQVSERVKVDPDNPISELPYGPIAVSVMGLGAAVYNEIRKRQIDKKYVETDKKYMATVKGVDEVLATMPSGVDIAKSALRSEHIKAGVYDAVKKDLKKVRGV